MHQLKRMINHRYLFTSILALCLISLVALLPTSAHASENRIALVIGNSDYKFADDLANPASDAKAIQKALEALNFNVISAFDLTYSETRTKLFDFNKQARGADLAIIYYAGHGIEVGGLNYLVPTDATYDSEENVDFTMIPLKMLTRAVSSVNGISVILLDSCRDNPFANADRSLSGSRGLAPVEAVQGTLISYAARAGTKASDGKGSKNSPYAEALIKHLGEPQTDIRRVFDKVRDTVMTLTSKKQEPVVYASLPAKDIFLSSITKQPPIKQQQSNNSNVEISYWESVKDTESAELLQSYLDEFENGRFVKIARFKLNKLNTQGEEKPSSQTPLLLTRDYDESSLSPEIAKFLLKAKDGDIFAQNSIGYAYGQGKIIEKNDFEQTKWYKLTADQGSDYGQYALGYAYQYGRGVDQNYQTAIELYNKSSDQGYSLAQMAMGYMHHQGLGLKQDYREAKRLYLLAAKQNVAPAQYNLGLLYEYGLGTDQDMKKAIEYYKIAVKNGSESAQKSLTRLKK